MSSPIPNESSKPSPPPVDEIPKGMDLVNYLAQCLEMGCDSLDVRKQLMAFGFSAADAEKVLADTTEWMRANPHAGKPAPKSPLHWALSHTGILVGVISCIVGVTAFAVAAGGEYETRTYAIAGTAVIFGLFAILWDVFGRVVR